MKKILLLALLFLILPNSIFAASESEIQSRLADEFSNLFCTPSLNADLIISGEAPGLTLKLGTSTKMAGSIVSLKVNNLETVNADDHGREIQYAFHDKLGEYNNPTEAGASADKDTSSSIFLGGCAINDKLYTKTKMAYWFPYNDKKTSDYVMEKIVQFGIPGMPNVIRFAAKFTLIENKHSLRFEIPTGYHTEEFNQVSFYNLKDKSYRPSVDQDFIYKPGYKYILSTIPLIPVLSNGTYSLAPYSVMFRDSHYSQHYAGHTNKWSLSQNIYNITAGKIYYTESFLVIDSPDKIKNSLELLINSQKNFSVVSPYSQKTQSFKGQLHTHTTRSDGVKTPAEVVTFYKDAGYNFISLTDHINNYNDPKDSTRNFLITQNPGISGILFIPGTEQTTPNNRHIGRINASNPENNLITNPQTLIDAIQAENGIAILNHPHWPAGLGSWSVAATALVNGYTAIEISNSLIGGTLINAEDVWDSVLTSGVKTWGVAADDCHNPTQTYCGTANIRVSANSLTKDEILNNIKSGNFYSAFIPSGNSDIKLTVTTSGNLITANTNIGTTIEFIGSGGAVKKKELYKTSSSYTPVITDKYIRIRASTGKSRAWSNPLYIETSTATPTLTPTPPPSSSVVGYIDGANCNKIIGWVCDPSNPNSPITVHVYANGKSGLGGTIIGSTIANLSRETAVGNYCGGNSSHGFNFTIPSNFNDNETHPLYLYAITGNNPLIPGSPKSITCSASTPTSPSLCTQCPNKPGAKLKGDSDCSGTTTLNDIFIWKRELTLGEFGTIVKDNWIADFDCNGKVTLNDASIWRENFIKSL